jgi:isoleucyl-tRNA synthetase
MTVSDEIFKRVGDSYRRIRNTARFMLSNLNGFEPTTDSVDPADMIGLDYWIVRQCQLLEEEVVDHYDNYNFHNIYQRVHNFCVNELGGFYLDIIKDRQYTCKSDGLARRSTQTAMHHVVEMLSRMIAPILSFTADEIWCAIPGDRPLSVFLSDFGDGVERLAESSTHSDAFWRKLIDVKNAVNKELEVQRAAKVVNANLSAEVDLYCEPDLAATLQSLGSELRFVLINSRATVHTLDAAPAEAASTELDGLKLKISASGEEKCERCWHHTADVGVDPAHPTICKRCVDNISGDGEVRHFA